MADKYKYAVVARLSAVAFVILIIFTIYCNFVSFRILPLLQIDIEPEYVDHHALYGGIWEATVVHLLLVMLIWCFKVTMQTDPGSIPDTVEWTTKPDPRKLNERKQTQPDEFRFCKFEKKFKPDRAHYCRQIGRNVLRMDHYCPWVYNCIGFYNHRSFLLLVAYANVACGYVATKMVYALSFYWSDLSTSFGTLFFTALSTILTMFIMVIIFPFMVFHVYLTFTNMTTLEYCENLRTGRWPQNPYDLGLQKNLRHQFGSNPLLWLIPLGKPEGDGLFFERSTSV